MSDLLTFVLQLKETVSRDIRKVGVTTSAVFSDMGDKIAVVKRGLDKLGQETKIKVDHSHLDELEEHLDRVNRKKEQLSMWDVAKGTVAGEMVTRGVERGVDFGIDFLKESVTKGMEGQKTKNMLNIMSPEHGEELYEQTHANLLKSMYGTQLFGDAKSLLASHLNNQQIDKRLRQFEDIAGGDAGNLDQLVQTYQLVKGTGKLNLHETFPLLRMGFDPISTLQQKYGGSTQQWHERLEDGAKGLKLFNEALDIATGKGGIFDHMQERLMQTDTGKYILASTNFEATKEEFGIKLLPIMGKLLDKLAPALDNLPATLDKLVPGIEYLGNKTVDLISWTSTHTGTIKEWIKTTESLIKWAVAAYATMTVINTGKGFMGGLSGAGEGIAGFSLAKGLGAATGGLEAMTGMAAGEMLAATGGVAALAYIATTIGWEIWNRNKAGAPPAYHFDAYTNSRGTVGGVAATISDSDLTTLPGEYWKQKGKLTDKVKKGASDASDALSDMSDSIIGGGPTHLVINARIGENMKNYFSNVKDGVKDVEGEFEEMLYRVLSRIPKAMGN